MMTSSSKHNSSPLVSPPPPPLDAFSLTIMKPRDKAALLRQRLLDLGVDVQCRRLTVEGGQRLPPARDFEMLFTKSPVLRSAWENFLLGIYPKDQVRLMRKNLRVVELSKKESEAAKDRERKRQRVADLKTRIAAAREENGRKEALLKSLNRDNRQLAAKSVGENVKRRRAALARSEKGAKTILATKFKAEEKAMEENRLKPVLAGLSQYHVALANAIGREGTAISSYASSRNDDSGQMDAAAAATAACLRSVFEGVEKNLGECCADVAEDAAALMDNNNNDDDYLNSSLYYQSLYRVILNYSRSSIVDAFVEEAEAANRRLLDATAVQAEDVNGDLDASTFNYSLDKSGIIVDEAACGNEETLLSRQEAAQRDLQLSLLKNLEEKTKNREQIEALRSKAAEVKEADVARGGLVKDGAVGDEKQQQQQRQQAAACRRVKAVRAAEAVLDEEKRRLRTIVDDGSDRVATLRKKREEVAATKVAMKLHDVTIEALTDDLKRTRFDAIQTAEQSRQFFEDEAVGTKEAAKVIAAKSAALAEFGQKATETLKEINLAHLPAEHRLPHRVDEEKPDERKRRLVRVVDSTPEMERETAHALRTSVSIPRSRQSFDYVVRSMTETENRMKAREEKLVARPEVKSLEVARDAADTWEAKKVEAAATNDANFAAAKQRMNRLMERCVELVATEKTLDEEGGFTALPEVHVEGKNWAEWKEELKDVRMKMDLAKK